MKFGTHTHYLITIVTQVSRKKTLGRNYFWWRWFL